MFCYIVSCCVILCHVVLYCDTFGYIVLCFSTMSDVIKQDFERLRVPWSTATKLCTLLAKCCMGFPQSQEFSSVFLPLVVDSFMELANNIQGSTLILKYSTENRAIKRYVVLLGTPQCHCDNLNLIICLRSDGLLD